MQNAQKTYAPDYGVPAKRSEQLQFMKAQRAKILERFKPRLEFVTFMEDNISSSDMWRDYQAALKLPTDFEKYIEDLEQLFTQREVLTFREELKGYKRYLEDFEKFKYLAEVDNEFLINNYLQSCNSQQA